MGLPTTRPAADTSAQLDPREASVYATAESGAFRKAPAVRTLLLYLWAHRDEALNEYRIATECLGKSQDFDPKLDATVRVHISRLRQKLKEHADAAGPGDALPQYRVTLPQGGYHGSGGSAGAGIGYAAIAEGFAPSRRLGNLRLVADHLRISGLGERAAGGQAGPACHSTAPILGGLVPQRQANQRGPADAGFL